MSTEYGQNNQNAKDRAWCLQVFFCEGWLHDSVTSIIQFAWNAANAAYDAGCVGRGRESGESATHYRWLTLVPSTSFSGVTLLRQIHGITVLKSQALLNRMTLEYHIICLPLFTSAFQRIFEGVRLLKARKAENPTLTFMTRYNVTPSESPMLER